MQIPIREILAISIVFGTLCPLPSQATPTSTEAAELAKAKAVLENHNASTKELNDTVEKLTALINKNPKLGEAYCYRGEIYDHLHKSTQSYTDFNSAIQANPKLGRAYVNRGIAMFFRNNIAAAISDFDNAIANGEKTTMAYQNRGAGYQQLEQHEKAIQDFTSSIAIKPEWPSYMMRATSYAATNKKELAIKDYSSLLAMKNVPAAVKTDAHEKRGYALANTNKLKEAIDDFTAAANGLTGEKKGRMIFLRASAHFKLGDKAAADADRKLAKSLGYPKDSPPDKPVGINSTDQLRRIEEAIKPLVAEARKTLPTAKAKYLKGLPSAHRFSVTTKLKDDTGRFEQVFVFVDGWKGTTIDGTLGSEVKLHGYKQGDKIKVDENDVIDWTISKPDGTEEGNLIGKFLDNWKG